MKKKIKEGDFFKIQLNNKYAYCRITEYGLVSFYDYFGYNKLSIDEIRMEKILFTIPVFHSAFKKWEKIGNLPLEENLNTIKIFCMQDVTNPSNIRIFDEGKGIEYPARYEDCIGLETYMVWEAEHVESRIIDYYNNKPNIWVESNRLKKP